jgi:hypothetical protein
MIPVVADVAARLQDRAADKVIATLIDIATNESRATRPPALNQNERFGHHEQPASPLTAYPERRTMEDPRFCYPEPPFAPQPQPSRAARLPAEQSDAVAGPQN